MGATGDFFNGLVAFFNAIDSALPTTVSISVAPTFDEIEDTTGVLTDSATAGSPTVIVGDVAGAYSAPSGSCITWLTDGVVNGRRVRGRTFIVPMANIAYEGDGTITEATRAAYELAANDLIDSAGGSMVVWHRPVAGAGGSSHVVQAARVKDTIAVLRSRRD